MSRSNQYMPQLTERQSAGSQERKVTVRCMGYQVNEYSLEHSGK